MFAANENLPLDILGCAIFAAIFLPLLLGLSLVSLWADSEAGPPAWLPEAVRVHLPGAAAMAPEVLTAPLTRVR